MAAEAVKRAYRAGPRSLDHRLAFGNLNGRSDMERSGLADINLTSATVAAIQTNEARKLHKQLTAASA